jgi:ParB family chromosome partitioning protein
MPARRPPRGASNLRAFAQPGTDATLASLRALTDAPREVLVAGSRMLAMVDIYPNVLQPRTHFDAELLDELAADIAAHGVLQPPIVRPRSSGEGYEIVAGERRYQAARLAGLEAIPVLVRELSDDEARVISLVENLQREDLSEADEFAFLSRLARDQGLSTRQIAALIHRSHMYVQRRLHVEEAGLTHAYARGDVTLEDVALTREQAQDLPELPEEDGVAAGGGRPGVRGRRAVDALRPYERLAAVARRTDFRALPDRRRARQVLAEALVALQRALDQLEDDLDYDADGPDGAHGPQDGDQKTPPE